MSDFKVGDVVMLKSGGPRMTVKELRTDGLVHCEWFDKDNKLRYEILGSESIEIHTISI